VEQVLYVADARHSAHLALDVLDLLGIFELPAQDHDPAVGIDADRSLGNRPIAEQLAFDLAHKADVVQLRDGVLVVRDRVRDPDKLARLVMGLALEPAYALAERGRSAVADEVLSPLTAARVEEELQRGAGRQSGRGDPSETTR